MSFSRPEESGTALKNQPYFYILATPNWKLIFFKNTMDPKNKLFRCKSSKIRKGFGVENADERN